MPVQFANDPENDFLVGPNGARIPRCKASKSDRSGRCGNPSMRFQDVCQSHGGKIPGALDAAERREKEHREQAEIKEFIGNLWDEDAPPIEDIHVELQRMLARHSHITRQLGRRLNAEECVCCGAGGDVDSPTFRALTTAVRESVKMLADAERLNLLDRSLQIEQQKSTMVLYAIFTAIEAVLPSLSDSQMHAIRSAFFNRLAALEKDPPSPDIKQVIWHGKGI